MKLLGLDDAVRRRDLSAMRVGTRSRTPTRSLTRCYALRVCDMCNDQYSIRSQRSAALERGRSSTVLNSKVHCVLMRSFLATGLW